MWLCRAFGHFFIDAGHTHFMCRRCGYLTSKFQGALKEVS